METQQSRGKQTMDRITRERFTSSVLGPERAFDLQSLAFLVSAIVGGVFLILFLLVFLPWLLSGALTAAVESLMRQVGFAKFTVDSIGDWVLVFVVGVVTVAFLVAAVTFIAGVANFLSDRLTFGHGPGAAVPAKSRVAYEERSVNGAAEGPLRETKSYEERTVDDLYAEARYRDIPGRSQMNKAQLIRALRRQ
jgi:hypothetical protein